MLSPNDFVPFFQEIHGHEPFPWQRRLAERVAEKGEWPPVLDLPTGSGKTAAIDIAAFHLALEADRGEKRRAPVRIAFVVDRRLVVDDAFAHAKKLEQRLAAQSQDSVAARVASCLQRLSGGAPLLARRLRGGLPREDDWARTPSQPTILCSTVDQVGSRLLFRGYGVSDSMKPVHAGLIGSDCLILLDEAHLAEPFRQTLGWVRTYKGANWRETGGSAPWGVALLTATPGEQAADGFSLDDEDRSHPILRKRLGAPKPARLLTPGKSGTKTDDPIATGEEDTDRGDKDLISRARVIVGEVREALTHFKQIENGALAPAIGVVVNRVARARATFDLLRTEFREKIESGALGEPILMIGPARPLDRDRLATSLEPIRTRTWVKGDRRTLDRPFVVVATQCIEAGVDIDLDALITEAAPLDALRQRFGRLNRAGRPMTPYASIIAAKSDLSKRADDPVYGKAIKATWDYLMAAAHRKGGVPVVDFGLNAFVISAEAGMLSPKDDAPVLLPAHLDLLSETSPIPLADPDVALYLHGPDRQPDSITVVWRADIDPANQRDEQVRRLLLLVPPRSPEAIELPLWAVRGWLANETRLLNGLADTATAAPAEERRQGGQERRRKIFRWKGDEDRSTWIAAADLRPGDTIIVPARYGGVDDFGWKPGHPGPATDIGRAAVQLFAGRRFAVRVAPGLLGSSVTDDALADALAGSASERWQDLRSALLALDLPQDIQDDLRALDNANRRKSVTATLDLYGMVNDRPRGVVVVAPSGINQGAQDEEGQPNATEDDAIGSLCGFALSLAKHSLDVEEKAAAFARSAGLSEERVTDLRLAGFLHDAGKADPRFQAWLHYGDPLGPDPDEPEDVLAKSGRFLPRGAREKSGLPENWRHEALSVRLARTHPRLATAKDPDLVLWLVSSHHGHGRPFFPHCDPTEPAQDVGPQSLAFDWQGLDWPSLFARLTARYGAWELARMEAVLRLADHRASEERAAGDDSK